MGAFISRQPNGKLCRFSTVVDTVTHWDMTEEEYIELCAEKARREARDIIDNYMEPFEEVKKSFWPNNHTIEEFNKILHAMGDEEGLGKERENAIRAEIKRNEEED